MTPTKSLTPDLALLVKLGSILVHVDEGLSAKGHPFDLEAIKSLMDDPDVRRWLAVMDKAAFLPIRRDGVRYKL